MPIDNPHNQDLIFTQKMTRFCMIKDYTNAKTLWDSIAEINQDKALAGLHLALLCFKKENNKKASLIIHQVLDNSPLDKSYPLNDIDLIIADLHSQCIDKSEYPLALYLAQTKLHICQLLHPSDHELMASNQIFMAKTQMYNSNSQEAKTALDSALEIEKNKNPGGSLQHAEVLQLLGEWNLTEEDYGYAVALFNRSLSMLKKLIPKEHKLNAELYNKLMMAFMFQEQMPQAIDYGIFCCSTYEQLGDDYKPQLIRAYTDLGTVYRHAEQGDEAQKFYDVALKTALEIFEHESPYLLEFYAQTLILPKDIPFNASIQKIYTNAIKQKNSKYTKLELAKFHNQMAIIYHYSKKYNEAEKTYKKALETIADTSTYRSVILFNLHDMYLDCDQPGKAERIKKQF